MKGAGCLWVYLGQILQALDQRDVISPIGIKVAWAAGQIKSIEVHFAGMRAIRVVLPQPLDECPVLWEPIKGPCDTSAHHALKVPGVPQNIVMHLVTFHDPGLDRDRRETLLPYEILKEPIAKLQGLSGEMDSLTQSHHGCVAYELPDTIKVVIWGAQ